MRSGSPLTTVGCRLDAEGDAVAGAALGPLDERAHDLVDAHVVDDVARLRAARELDDVADERGQLVELRDDVGAQALALGLGQPVGVLEHLDVGAQAGDRRAQLVAGVGHEVALRLDRALERVERRVEAAREAGELVLALDLEPLREVGVGRQRLGAAGEARDRRERGARDDAAEHGRHEDADAADGEQDEQQLRAARGRPRSAAARPAPRRARPSPTVSTRRCTPLTCASLK